MRKKAPTMGCIMQSNRNKETDRLYEPLRNAIIKASQSKDHRKGKNDHANQPLSVERVRESRLSKRIHELNPKQAQDMEKNIKIPKCRKLVPISSLKELKDLKSHNYKALDVNVKKYQPISADQLRERLATINYQQVEQIYKIDSNPTSLNESQFHPIDEGNLGTKNKFPFDEDPYQLNKKPTERHLQKRVSTEDVSPIDNLPHYEKNYLTKNILDDETSTQTRYKRTKSAKSDYKYNLFSAIDEGVNTKCQTCWTGNEIIATKPRKQPWS